jgi:hypothetical protein
MELARKISRDALGEGQAPGAARSDFNSLASLDKALRLALAPTEQATEARPERNGPAKRDLSAALDLVHQAAESIRVTEHRAREMEARTRALADRATEELKLAEQRIQAAEARARAAEERAQQAEARTQEAEEWLKRIHDVIVEELPPRPLDPQTQAPVQLFERTA